MELPYYKNLKKGDFDLDAINMINVSASYNKTTLGVKDININIQQGEFVFLSGKSGSGKTTLISLIAKVIEPTNGEIIVLDQNIANLTRKQLPYYRRKLGVLFQDFILLPNKTAYQNISIALEAIQYPISAINDLVPTALALVGLNKKSNMFPNQLSGGEQTRLALARTIVSSPPILMVDEPTANLDPDVSWDIMCLLQEINKNGTTIIVSTHGRELVNMMKKRVITLNNGAISRDEKKSRYYI